jgi:hypothetical protein
MGATARMAAPAATTASAQLVVGARPRESLGKALLKAAVEVAAPASLLAAVVILALALPARV